MEQQKTQKIIEKQKAKYYEISRDTFWFTASYTCDIDIIKSDLGPWFTWYSRYLK